MSIITIDDSQTITSQNKDILKVQLAIELSGSRRKIMLHILKWYPKKCYESLNTICKRTGLSRRGLIYCLKYLVENNYLEKKLHDATSTYSYELGARPMGTIKETAIKRGGAHDCTQSKLNSSKLNLTKLNYANAGDYKMPFDWEQNLRKFNRKDDAELFGHIEAEEVKEALEQSEIGVIQIYHIAKSRKISIEKLGAFFSQIYCRTLEGVIDKEMWSTNGLCRLLRGETFAFLSEDPEYRESARKGTLKAKQKGIEIEGLDDCVKTTFDLMALKVKEDKPGLDNPKAFLNSKGRFKEMGDALGENRLGGAAQDYSMDNNFTYEQVRQCVDDLLDGHSKLVRGNYLSRINEGLINGEYFRKKVLHYDKDGKIKMALAK